MLNLALSPYLLTTREAPAMAAILLGDHVVTLLPEPRSGTSREQVRAAVRSAPRLLRLLESWRWSAALWKAGVLKRGSCGASAASGLPRVFDRIADERELEPLRRLTRHIDQLQRESAAAKPHGAHDRYLDALCSDVLKGGADPGFNTTMTAALDAHAAAGSMPVVRSGVDSVVQRAEGRLSRRLASVSLPVLTHASGRTLLDLRHDLAGELATLREAVRAVFDESLDVQEGPEQQPAPGPAVARLRDAAEQYARAFSHWAGEHLPGDDESGERLVQGYVTVTLSSAPADMALSAGRIALTSMQAAGARPSTAGAGPTVGARAGTRTPRLLTLTIREVNVRPA